jgi:hypothetical protein
VSVNLKDGDDTEVAVRTRDGVHGRKGECASVCWVVASIWVQRERGGQLGVSKSYLPGLIVKTGEMVGDSLVMAKQMSTIGAPIYASQAIKRLIAVLSRSNAVRYTCPP